MTASKPQDCAATDNPLMFMQGTPPLLNVVVYLGSKRPRAEHSHSHSAAAPISSVESDDSGTSKKRRESSHALRKREIEELQREIERLNAKAATLRGEAGIPDSPDPRAVEEAQQLRDELQRAVQSQFMLIANLEAALTDYRLNPVGPLDTFIRLGTDWDERRRTIHGLKNARLAAGHSFLNERTRGLDLTRAICDDSKQTTTEDDFIAVRLQSTPFPGVQSVKRVFDAMHFFLCHIEMETTELTDHVAVREDDARADDATIMNHRLVVHGSNGVLVEKNALKFLEYYGGPDEEADGSAMGLVVSDCVDHDELYPYDPEHRARMDLSMAIKISWQGKQPSERVVVLTLWMRAKVVWPTVGLSSQLKNESKGHVLPFMDSILLSIQQSLKVQSSEDAEVNM